MFQGEADIVEPFQQNVLPEFGNFELAIEAVCVRDCLRGQVHGQRVAILSLRAAKQLVDLNFREDHGENAILETIAIENIREAR